MRDLVSSRIPYDINTPRRPASVDAERVSFAPVAQLGPYELELVHFEAGARQPQRSSRRLEYFYVMDGELLDGATSLQPHCVYEYRPGSLHELSSPGGATYVHLSTGEDDFERMATGSASRRGPSVIDDRTVRKGRPSSKISAADIGLVGGHCFEWVRFEPGAVHPLHLHLEREFLLAVSGDLHDGHSPVPLHTLIEYPPGSAHQIYSQHGASFLLIWTLQSRIANLEHLFAYGPWVDAGQLEKYGIRPSSSCAASIDGWALDLASMDGRGTLTVRPAKSQGAALAGRTHKLSQDDWRRLLTADHGAFTPRVVKLLDEAGEIVDAVLYAGPSVGGGDRPPVAVEYRQRVRAAYKSAGLSVDEVERLLEGGP